MHGGLLPPVRAAAEREYFAILNGERGYVSDWQKAELIRNFEAAQRRWTARQERKYGPTPAGAANVPEPGSGAFLARWLTADEIAAFEDQKRQQDAAEELWDD